MAGPPAPYLQEFESLDEVLTSVPHRTHPGLLNRDLEWTCVDATHEYIAIGTSSSIVCLYDRLTAQVKKLNVKSQGISITCVKLINSVDYEVAVGTSLGHVFIYVLPSNLPGRNKTLQVYTVSGLHTAPITCLEWSQNAMKIFSGDKTGNVVCTEIDYTESTSKSHVLCRESCDVVQLSYCRKILLVSTSYRTILVTTDPPISVIQVGTKDRKVNGPFGAVFQPTADQSRELSLFCSRPGLRLWQAKSDGKVTATYIFKELITEDMKNVSLLPDSMVDPVTRNTENCQFGPLLLYRDSYLLSHRDSALYVIDPLVGVFTSYHTSLGMVEDVAVCEDEVFLLRRKPHRVLIRLAHKPMQRVEVPSHLPLKKDNYQKVKPSSDTSPVQVFSDTASKVSHSFLGMVKGVGEKLQSVKEGRKATVKARTPPWGAVGDDNPWDVKTGQVECMIQSTESVDSAQELSPSYEPSPTRLPSASTSQETPVHSGKGPDKLGNSEVRQDGVENSGKVQDLGHAISKTEQIESKSDSHELRECKTPPPIVTLDGDQLTVIKIERSYHSSRDKEVRVDSTSSDTGRTISDVVSASHGSRHKNFETVGSDQYEDLVYQRKTKKPKKKKAKADTASIMSVDSLDRSCDVSPSASLNSKFVAQSSNSTTSSMPPELPTVDSSPADLTESTANSQRMPSDRSQITPTSHTSTLSPFASPETSIYARTQTIDSIGSSNSSPSTPPNVKQIHSTDNYDDINDKVDDARLDNDIQVVKDLDIDLEKLKSDKNITDVFGEMEKCDHGDASQEYVAMVTQTVDDVNETAKDETVISSNSEESKTKLDELTSKCDLDHDFDQNTKSTATKPNLDNTAESRDSNTQSLPHDIHPLTLDLKVKPDRTNHDPSGFGAEEQSVLSPDSMTQSGGNVSVSDSDDFYSLYNAQPFSPSSPDTPQGAGLSLEAAVEYENEQVKLPDSADSPVNASSKKSPSTDSWTDYKTPANIQSMCLTNRHILFVDKSFRVHYSVLGGPTGLRWQILPEAAKYISVSPSGWIVWRLHKNVVYVGTNVSPGYPAGKQWREIAKDVAHISVDDKVAWYIKLSGEVAMHKGLSRSRPCDRFVKVECPHQVSEVCCRYGVVWALTTDRNIITRAGIKPGREQGTDWVFLQGEGPCQLVSSFALGDKQTAWILDLVGRVWFTTGVTPEKPSGNGLWWQVPLSEYLMQDSKASQIVKSLLEVPQNLSKLVSSDRGGVICAGGQGVWVCPGRRNMIHVCRSTLTGHRWQNCILSNMVPSTRWLHVSASAVDKNEGLIWVQQSSGSLFCFSAEYRHARILEIPAPVTGIAARTLSATREAVWVLLTDGSVYVRTDVSPHCQQGLHWARLNLTQLDPSQFMHLSCGEQTVWAVDDLGTVYMRIGTQAPGPSHLSPAWVPVDGCTKDSTTKFVKVFVGTDDQMVWGLDNKMNVYVRRGITDELPLGKYWSYVPGTSALSLCVSQDSVYALNQTGEVLVRCGISDDNTDGNYWKTCPGAYSAISITGNGQLWAIDKEDLLYRRHLYHLCHHDNQEESPPREGSTEEGWELL